MATEKTFAIVKPDAVEKNHIGGIIGLIEKNGLKVKAMRMMHMTRPIAEGFYAVHKERPFFGELVDFMTRGPCVVMVLEGDNAIAKWREIMGATDPKKAADGTVRKLFGANVGENASHGSDGPDTAKFEIGWFFPGYGV
jgi:nucleoside-diphosphate kinase